MGESGFLVRWSGGLRGGLVEVGEMDRAVGRRRGFCGFGRGWLNGVSLRLLSSPYSLAFGSGFLPGG